MGAAPAIASSANSVAATTALNLEPATPAEKRSRCFTVRFSYGQFLWVSYGLGLLWAGSPVGGFSYRWGGFGAVGLSPPEEPANTLRPSGSLTRRALHVFEPSFASTPSMVIWSLGFKELLLQPFRVSVFGGPPSHCQCCRLP